MRIKKSYLDSPTPRFIGMGTGNKSLYIFGGVTLFAGITLKQLGSVRGARKRLGQ